MSEEERWQGMLCAAGLWRVPWPPNSHLAAAQGQKGLNMDRGARVLWENRVPPAALPSLLDSGNGTGIPSCSAHLWGKACLDQTSGTPGWLPWKEDVLTGKLYMGMLYHSKFWVFWWRSLQGSGWYICVQLQQHPFGLMTGRHCVTDLS